MCVSNLSRAVLDDVEGETWTHDLSIMSPALQPPRHWTISVAVLIRQYWNYTHKTVKVCERLASVSDLKLSITSCRCCSSFSLSLLRASSCSVSALKSFLHFSGISCRSPSCTYIHTRSCQMLTQLTSASTPLVGGVAQWLGRQSVAGGLSLIYAWSMVEVWPLCG